MLSYHDDESLKSKVVSEMKKHQEQDQFIKGVYGLDQDDKFKGCSVGCTIDSINVILGKSYDTSKHKVLEKAIGIPEWLAKLQDTLFEGLPFEEGAQFSVDFLSAIPVGVNLEPVKWHFCAFVLKECIERMLGLPNISEDLREQVVNAIKGVLTLHESAILSGTWDHVEATVASAANEAKAAEQWVGEAAWAAESWVAAWAAEGASRAAWAAAEAAREAAGAEAAWAAAEAAREAAGAEAAWATARAAWAAAGAWATEAAVAVVAEWAAEWATGIWDEEKTEDAYKRYSDELIRVLKETKGAL